MIGLLHQHAETLDGIQAAVDGVHSGVELVGRSVSALSTGAVVGLG